jgi:hypothetical protein
VLLRNPHATFETYLIHELSSHVDNVSGEALGNWRSKSGFEVDFIRRDHTAVEGIAVFPFKTFLEAFWAGKTGAE